MYEELYQNIIDKAKKENRIKNQSVYYERHHIIPDFLFSSRKRRGPKGHLAGDPDSPENIILLTFSEHLMAHYYLYEIYKNTIYEYSAGSALQFFFVKATGNHRRQINLTEVDKKFLQDMEHLRRLGNISISNARRGKMPVVDAVTRKKIGSVATDHPKVLSGEWIHHCKGLPSTAKYRKSQKGENNNNYKELTHERKYRLFKCVVNSCQDNYLKVKLLNKNIKQEFTEFDKISHVWILNNFGSFDSLVKETNEELHLTIKYNPYHRSQEQRKIASEHSSKHRWYNNGVKNIRVTNEKEFCKNNPEFVLGKIKL